MADYEARGLGADWLNAWLAAIGVTVLVPGARLAWTEDPVPRARFAVPDGCDLPAAVADALPTGDTVAAMAIAGLRQAVTADDYHEVAARARTHRDDTLAVLVTDLARSEGTALYKGNFNVGAEGKSSLDKRLADCCAALGQGAERTDAVTATFAGRGRRVPVNGLGFDYRRLAGPTPMETDKLADPVIETLAFYGTLFFPARGDGQRLRQRGWITHPKQRHRFVWPAWRGPLGRWAIDGLLDRTYATTITNGALRDSTGTVVGALERWGVTALYGAIPFDKAGNAVTKGYAAERLA